MYAITASTEPDRGSNLLEVEVACGGVEQFSHRAHLLRTRRAGGIGSRCERACLLRRRRRHVADDGILGGRRRSRAIRFALAEQGTGVRRHDRSMRAGALRVGFARAGRFLAESGREGIRHGRHVCGQFRVRLLGLGQTIAQRNL